MTLRLDRWASAPGAIAAGLAIAALTLYATVFADAYAVRLLTLAGIYALAVIGYQIVFGHAGAISLAQGAFFGLGGYASGLLAHQLGLPFVVGFPAAILAAALVAGLIAMPILKLESHYLALATLALAELAMLAVLSWDDLTGGANGLSGIPAIEIGGVTIGRGLALLAFVWLCVALGAFAASRWLGGFVGHALASVRADPLAAACSGLDVGALRAKALVASAMFAAGGGALSVHTLGVVSPDLIGFPVMVTILAMTVIGGSRSIGGGIAAALLLVHLPEWFRFLERYYLIAYGAAMLATMVLVPEGLGTVMRRLAARPRPPVPTPAPPAPPTRHPDGNIVLDLAHLSKRFGGVTALADVSLAMNAGEILGLIGPNGSGKSTLLNVIGGLVVPDAGQVRLAGRDITGLAPHRIAVLGVGRSFQTPSATAQLTALDAVAVACGAGGAPYALARRQAMALLAELGAEAVAAQPCLTLPPAMRRRIEIARALARAPRLVLLDEPAAGLAEPEHRDLAHRIKRIAAGGVAIVIVEHNLPFLLDTVDRVICLDGGRIIAAGAPAAIRVDPRVIGAYLGDGGAAP